VASIDLVITDLDAIKRACDACGLEFMEGQKTFTWYGRWLDDWNDPARAAAMKGFDPKTYGQCEHAIRRAGHKKGDYEMGLVPRRDGLPGWEVVVDFWGSGRYFSSKFGGPDMPELKNEYGAAMSERYWQSKGYITQRQRNAKQELQIHAYSR
jgi:hypothetical protein